MSSPEQMLGHKGGLTAKWALNNMERQLNFGHLAIHRTQAVAKAIINSFYCAPPAYSYFVGLSRGGGQAMMEAQRYPDDFDGIAAGFPAFNWVGFSAEFVQNLKKFIPIPTVRKSCHHRENLQLLQKMIMQKCDMLDGVRDTILNDPENVISIWMNFRSVRMIRPGMVVLPKHNCWQSKPYTTEYRIKKGRYIRDFLLVEKMKEEAGMSGQLERVNHLFLNLHCRLFLESNL